jgi:hypothetical protein
VSGGAPDLWSRADAVIFTGVFGSGKTEVSINYALAAHAAGMATCIVDFDIVTPYFRVGDQREELQNRGLRVVAPHGRLASFELPAVSPEVNDVLSDPSLHLVIDVGGDPEGARLVRTHAEQIARRRYESLVVINPFRPATSSAEEIVVQSQAIAAEADLPLTGLVANPNLGPLTQAADVIRGMADIQRAATLLALPVVLLAVPLGLTRAGLGLDVPVLPMELIIRLPWQ